MSRESLVGTTLAGYEIRSVVGEGGTSAVYRADHPTHGTVALKVLRDRLRQDRTAVARFVREAQYGGRVLHPNVVRTIEIGEAEPGLHFLAIEWAGGEILERYAKRNCPLPATEVADIVEQIAAAVQAAHDAGIVHRDLKPENVMYDPAMRQVKLLDFGIAAETDQGADERLTRAGFFVGTLMYVAPEALSGEMVTAAADQYSLATIAYFLLSGCHPYSGKSPREMFTQLLSQPPQPLGKAKEGLLVAPAVEAVVMRGLAKSPVERYPDVRTFAREVRNALDAPATAEPEKGGQSGMLGKIRGLFKR
ncbi:MAG: serine/threonine-protein kinase [Gemmatirosa sp.]